MKAAGHILLLALYCVVTIGMTISTHYCGIVPVSSHLGASTAEPDTCCGASEAGSECCTTVITTCIVSDDHTASAHEVSSTADVVCILPAPTVQAPAYEPFHLHQPSAFPPGSAPPLTILNSCFLI